MQLPETLQKNSEKLKVDLKEHLPPGESILVISYYKSRYPIAIALKSATTDMIIKQLEQIFTMLEYPYILVSHNGTQSTSHHFELYLQIHNIKHQLISFYWPHAK